MVALLGAGLLFGGGPAVAQPAPPSSPATSVPAESESAAPGFLRPRISCPQDLERLSELLVRDLPSYANRVMQRSLGQVQSGYRPTYVILASRPELEPLAISDQVYTTDPAAGDKVQQVFFTTLERQYEGDRMGALLHYHWLFLAPAGAGWQPVFMFSTIGGTDPQQPVLPPRDSSDGSIGQAVRLWLRDCRAGAIYPLDERSDERSDERLDEALAEPLTEALEERQ